MAVINPSVTIVNGTVDNSPVGATTASTGRFTTVTSTVATGTAPFTVASTTQVANLNAATAGSSATLTTPRAIYGNNFDGSAALTGIIASTYGGTGNGFTKFSGATTAEKTYTLPDATATILTTNAAVTIGQGGTGQTAKTAAFDALSPTTTKGDLIVFDGTNNVRIPVGTNNYVLTADSAQASGVKWAVGGSGSGTVTSVGGTGTVNGLTLTGTVTTSGNLTLGGTLDLSSPPAIGGTSPAAGTFTTLSLTGTSNQVSSVAVSSDPAAPSAGNLKTFAKTVAGYTAPAFLNATNAVVQLQPSFGFKRIIQSRIQPGSTAISVFPTNGLGTINTIGTATAVSSANTNFFSRIAKTSYLSNSTAASISGNYYNGFNVISTTLGVPGTPNYGGFLLVYNFGIGDTVASPRTFNGLTSSTGTATNVEPSTLTNCIGVGQGAANTNLFIYYGGSAAQTPIDLGSNFPTGTSGTDFYQVVLFAPPSSNNTVYYQVTRLNTGNVATGTLTGTAGTVLPANTTNLYYRNWRTNNATASAVTIYQGDLYLETDY
jgi:hypothetical protein